MQVSGAVRYSVLALVALAVAGFGWLGMGRLRAEQRALAYVKDAQPAERQAASGEFSRSVVQATAPAETAVSAPRPADEKVLVHVAGAVTNPGVYRLERGARVSDAVAAAGGALPEGMADALNLAAPVNDGEKVYLPSKQEALSQAAAAPAARGAAHGPAQSSGSGRIAAGTKVNVNTATAGELQRVSGIGPKIAADILAYRSAHGPFKRLEDLDKVTGIGPATLTRIRPFLSL